VSAPGEIQLSRRVGATGLEQLAHLEDWCRARARLAQGYFECLAGGRSAHARETAARDNPGHSWNMFTVLLPLQALRSTRKPSWTRCRRKASAPASLRSDPPHHALPHRDSERACSRSRSASRRETVTLPLFPEMREMDVERVCESMKRVMRRKAA